MKILQRNKGITLIALIVTIIVLLILAGVSLNLVAGGDGILGRAENAVNETEIASAKEQAELLIVDYQTEWYQKKYVDNVEAVANQTKTEYVIAQIGSSGKTTSNGEYTVTIEQNGENGKVQVAKDGKNVATGTLKADGELIWDEEIAGESEEKEEITEVLKVGDEVSYTPSGTYTEWTTAHSGYGTSYSLASGSLYTGASSQTDMTISNWKVFKIDEATGEVELVPSSPTTNSVGLKGADGYNNAVKLLNDACSSLYSDSSKGITARSINIEDIESVLDYYPTTYENTQVDLNYGQKYSSAYTSYNQYPAIYAEEIDSVITPTPEGKSKILGLSDAANGWITTGSVTNATSIHPKQTYYRLEYSDFSSKLKMLNEVKYSDLLLPSDDSTQYWVASRCVDLGPTLSDFLVQSVFSGGLTPGRMFYSRSDIFERTCPLFPIVSLSADLISGDATSGWSVE